MGCPRHLKWSPVKGESGGSLSSMGLKGKRQRKGKGASAFRSLLLPGTLSLLGLGVLQMLFAAFRFGSNGVMWMEWNVVVFVFFFFLF